MQQPRTESQTAASPAANTAQPVQKHQYQSPELRCYGSVTEITLGTGGVRLDGRTNTRKS